MNKRKRFWVFVALRTIANVLIISGIIFSFLSFGPFIQQEVWYFWNNNILKTAENTKVPDAPGGGVKATELPPIPVSPKDKNFGIYIQKIGVNAPVLQDVDPTNYNQYIAALSVGVAHARGTALPGSIEADNNNVFLFAHSAINAIEARAYNSVFYLLRKLEKGDRVSTFYKGKRFDYIVRKKQVVEATDVRYLTDPSEKPILTLQTCDPPGSSLRRLIITADLVQ